jgi:predicted dehydrogenase
MKASKEKGRDRRSVLSRRRFLRQALGAAALPAAPSIIPASAIGAFGAVAPSNRVTVGYIGTGVQGLGVNLRELMLCRDAQVLAVCDVYAKNRDRGKAAVDAGYKNQDCRAYVDFRELLARPDIDAVGIATPDHWHVPMAVAAVKAGKDVHVEKPLGVCLAQDLACRDVVKRYGRVFQYGTESRSSASCRLACEIVRNGLIGEIREIHVTSPGVPGWRCTGPPQPVPSDFDYELFLGPAPWRPFTGMPVTVGQYGSWYGHHDYCAGAIANWGAHLLDILVWGFDTHLAGPWEVEGTGHIAEPWGTNEVLRWDVRIRFGNGVRMTYRSGGDMTRFVGTDGEIAVGHGGRPLDPKTKALMAAPPGRLARRLTVSDAGHEHHWIGCVKTRATPVSPIDDAVHSDIIAHVSQIAVRTGRRITWDPVTETIVGDAEASRYLLRAMRAPWRLCEGR